MRLSQDSILPCKTNLLIYTFIHLNLTVSLKKLMNRPTCTPQMVTDALRYINTVFKNRNSNKNLFKISEFIQRCVLSKMK